MVNNRPYILSIAGHDPSGGAGLTADIKTFERLKCYGLSVCSANTIQNDQDFYDCHWTPLAHMKKQIDVLWERFSIDYVKIGIVENWTILLELVDYVREKNPQVKIVLDPVLKSSSNYTFHSSSDSEFLQLLPKLFLITPNRQEIENLFGDLSIKETVDIIHSKTNVLLKGGHFEDSIGEDILYPATGETQHFFPQSTTCTPKHGSGCVLSSAIASHLALGFSLSESVKKSKSYVESFLNSNTSLLGYHG